MNNFHTLTIMNLTVSTTLLLVVFSLPIIVESTLCRSCSWSGVKHWSQICARSDISWVPQGDIPTVNCGKQNCEIRRVMKAGGGFHSFSRGCTRNPPKKTSCSKDTYFRTCITVCNSDNCNVKETVRAPRRSIPSLSPDLHRMHHIFSCFLNLIVAMMNR